MSINGFIKFKENDFVIATIVTFLAERYFASFSILLYLSIICTMIFNNLLRQKEFYFFTSKINNFFEENILKFKNVSIIYNSSNINYHEFIKINNFCRKNLIKIYILDNYRAVIKYNLNGLIISNKCKILYLNSFSKKIGIKVIGKVHNQKEFFLREQQNCDSVFFSPFFLTSKYSENKVLGPIKFNLISQQWRKEIFCLGGINSYNYKKTFLSKNNGFGFFSLIKSSKIKKPFPSF